MVDGRAGAIRDFFDAKTCTVCVSKHPPLGLLASCKTSDRRLFYFMQGAARLNLSELK